MTTPKIAETTRPATATVMRGHNAGFATLVAPLRDTPVPVVLDKASRLGIGSLGEASGVGSGSLVKAMPEGIGASDQGLYAR